MDTGMAEPSAKFSDVDTRTALLAVHGEPFPHIRCRTCDAYQLLQNSTRSFNYSPGCALKGSQSRFPWRDLLWIVGHIDREAK